MNIFHRCETLQLIENMNACVVVTLIQEIPCRFVIIASQLQMFNQFGWRAQNVRIQILQFLHVALFVVVMDHCHEQLPEFGPIFHYFGTSMRGNRISFWLLLNFSKIFLKSDPFVASDALECIDDRRDPDSAGIRDWILTHNVWNSSDISLYSWSKSAASSSSTSLDTKKWFFSNAS